VLGGVPLLASFENTCKIEAATGHEGDPVRRLAALGVSVVEDAERLWQRLRLTNSEHARLTSIAEGWQQISPAQGEAAARERLYRIGPDGFVDRVLVAWSRSPAGATDPEWTSFAALPARWMAPTFPIKSKEFTRRGIEKGPRLGAALAAAEEAWIAADFPADKATLAAIADAAAAAVTGAPS